MRALLVFLDRLADRIGLALWCVAAPVVGFAGAVAADALIARDGYVHRAPLPEIVYEDPSAGPVSWRDVIAGAPRQAVREAAETHVEACVAGPIAPRTPIVRAGHYPFNVCACLVSEGLTIFSPAQMSALADTFKRGAVPPARVLDGWIEIRRRCQGVGGDRRRPPLPLG